MFSSAKCPEVPSDIKSELVAAKSRHAEQRRNVVQGTQLDYFQRLWDRLWASSGDGGGGVILKSNPTSAAGSIDSDQGGEEGFKDHILIMDYIRTTEPWSNNRAIGEACDTYYRCLEYGGRICHTPSMPRQFSAEWLLAKVVPRRAPAKRLSMPG